MLTFGRLIRDSPLIQQLSCLHVSNGTNGLNLQVYMHLPFWTICPIFKNDVLLDSFAQAEMSYDINFLHFRFYQKCKKSFYRSQNLYSLHTKKKTAFNKPSSKVIIWIFESICPLQPVEMKFSSIVFSSIQSYLYICTLFLTMSHSSYYRNI